jgi:protein tyrosine/serine phosphatase
MSVSPTPDEPFIGRWAMPMGGFRRRLRAYFSMIVFDHGFARYLYLNLHRFGENAWRSAQPAPQHIAGFARRGIRTIVKTRGGMDFGSLTLENEACARHGITLERYVLSSRGLPSREFLLQTPAFFDSLQKPVLFHCKSGSDRVGFAAALYLILHEKRSIAEARKQLSWRYGHFRFALTGVLDAFFEAYEREGESQGLTFLEWVATVYDPDKIKSEFKAHWLHHFLTQTILLRE